MAKKTVDEKFVLKVYEMAKLSGSPSDEVNQVEAGLEIGEKGKKIGNIVGLLANSGFIIKRGENTLTLTSKGINLAEDLLLL